MAASSISVFVDLYFRFDLKSVRWFYEMKSTRMKKRRASAKPTNYKRLRNDDVEMEATDKSVPGDLDFYIDDDGNLETLEIGSIPNLPTVADSPVRPDTPLPVSNFKLCLSFYYFQAFHNSQLHCTLYTLCILDILYFIRIATESGSILLGLSYRWNNRILRIMHSFFSYELLTSHRRHNIVRRFTEKLAMPTMQRVA